jgi:glycosyltransferase involved in cell wall biosynthesis
MSDAMVLGYLTNQYGRASDTFIRQEVWQLRKLGHAVHTFSIRRPEPEHAISAEVRDEQLRTEYILEAGPLALAGSLLACAVRRPRRAARAAWLAWRTAAPGLRGLVYQGIYLLEAARLARRVESLGIEHLHDHIAMNSATVCMLAATLSGVSWSMTVHGPHDFVEPMRWALPAKLEAAAFSVFIADFGRSQGMGLVPTSVWPKLHVVRCGLDDTFLGHPEVAAPLAKRLVFVGRLSPEKGAVLLLEAAALLRGEGLRVELVLIGDGPSRPELERAVAEKGLGDAVSFLGWRGSEQVRQAILESRALVLPSFAEGLPIVLMEALALHRPVVSTYVAGIPELVQPGKNGFLVPPGSVAELASALRAVVTASTDALTRLGRNGAARVAERHDAAANARQLERLLWQAVATRRSEQAGGRATGAPANPR